jgi:allantoinase
MKPRPYGPFPYSPVIRRPKLTWPDGARVALWVIPNVEFFSLEERPAGYGATKIPDVVMWSERDYGNRVGIWRLMEVLDRYRIRASVALNSLLCDHHPVIIEEGNKRKWEWMGHNESNTRRLNEATPDEEAQIINRTFATIERATGARPKGWLSSGLQETWDSLDLLAAPHRIGALDAALEYICRHDGVWRATGAEIAEFYLSPAAAAHRGDA